MRKCDRCQAEMAPGRPRVRVSRQLWCQTCVKDKSAPSGKYKPGSDIATTAGEKRKEFRPLPRWSEHGETVHPLKREDAPHWAGESELGSALRGTMEGLSDTLHGLTHPEKAKDEGSFPIDTGVERWRGHPELGGASNPHNPNSSWGMREEQHPRAHELGMPNLKAHQDPHDKENWTNITACPNTFHDDDPWKAFPPKEVSESGYGGTPEHPDKKHYKCPNPNCGAFKVYHASPYDREADTKQRLLTSEPFTPRQPLPHSLNSRKIAAEDFVSRAQADHEALQARYQGQHGAVTRGPDGEPVYEISHPSGYLGRIGHGPYMAISHQATPERTYDTQSVGAMTDSGHTLHPSMATDDPLVNHHRAMWHLDNWVKTWGETHSQTTPAIKNWKGRRGLASKASTESKEPGFMKKVALTNIRTGQRIIVVAHDSGDGQTIYHCPFCGSGQVIARSDGTIECEFCHTMFTVQVQPEYNAFPQTINGQPVQVPGMPGQIDDPTDPMAGADLNDPTQTDADQDGEADATDGDTNGDGVSDNFAGPASADNQPPWLKGAVLRTSTGAYLNPDDFVAHLAIKHADDRSAAIQQVRATRRSQ